MASELLTTGEVANLCGVTPDSVLKWIKAGKLPATRTPGGHYRVSRETCIELGLGEPDAGAAKAAELAAPGRSGVTRCWEYFGTRGEPRDTCLSCVAYLSQAQHCYKLAELGERSGHRRNFCDKDDCEPCSFYRALHGLATAVLVVTRDDALTRRIERGIDAEKISLRVVRSGYEASMAIAEFHPSLVLLDSDLPEVREGQLPEHIMRDERVPGIAVFVACREGHEVTVDSVSAPTIVAPFTAKQIEDLADVIRRRGPASTGVAAPGA